MAESGRPPYLQRIERVRERLEKLEPTRRCVFACCCAERLEPNYRAFALDEGREPGVVGRALDVLWAFFETPDTGDRVATVLAELEAISFDDSCRSVYRAIAEEAVYATKCALRCWSAGDLEPAVRAAKVSWESVGEWILMTTGTWSGLGLHEQELCKRVGRSWSGTPIPESKAQSQGDIEWQEQHPLLLDEVEKELFDLDVLARATSLDHGLLMLLRKSSAERGIQPFRRGIAKQ